jgi:hypothetical protein
MKSWRIVLEFSTTDDNEYSPEAWDWYNFVNIGPNEAISVVSADEIETPEGHIEELAQDSL